MENIHLRENYIGKVKSTMDTAMSNLDQPEVAFMSREQEHGDKAPAVITSDIWSRIAEYVPPSPITYSRLARVSKLFYRIFLSDALWRQLDLYDVKYKIHLHYIYTISNFNKDERHFIRPASDPLAKRTWQCSRKRGGPSSARSCFLIAIFLANLEFANYDNLLCDECVYYFIRLTSDTPYLCLLATAHDSDSLPKELFTSDFLARLDLNRLNLMLGMGTHRTTAHILMTRRILVHTCGLLQYATAEERNDFSVVMRAVHFDGLQLQYADSKLQSNERIVFAAICDNVEAARFANTIPTFIADYCEFKVLTSRRQQGAYSLPDL